MLELEPGGQALRLVAGVGWRPGLVGRTSVGAELDSQAGYTLVSDEPVIVEDLRQETRFSGPPLLQEHQVVSGMSVIIRGENDDQPYGVLGTHTTARRQFTQDDIHFLEAMANILAAAIRRDRDRQRLEALNQTLEQRVAKRTAEAEQCRAQQLRALASQLTDTEQRERRRLAQTLHDHHQQLLVAVKMRLSLLKGQLEADPQLAGAGQIDRLLDEAIQSSPR